MITPQEAEQARRDLAVAKYSSDIERYEKAIDAHLVESAGNVAADGSTDWVYGVRGIVPIVIEALVAKYASHWNATFDQSGEQIVFRIGPSKPKRKRGRKPARTVDAQGASTVEDAEQDELAHAAAAGDADPDKLARDHLVANGVRVSGPRTGIDPDGEYTTDGKRW